MTVATFASVPVERTTKRLCCRRPLYVGGSASTSSRPSGERPPASPFEVTAGIPYAPAIRFDASNCPAAEIFLITVLPPLRAAYRTSPDGACTDVASPGQGPTANAAPAAPSAAAIATTATIERDTRISASLGRHRWYTGPGRSVPPFLQPAADPATIGRSPTMSRVFSVEGKGLRFLWIGSGSRRGSC